MGSASESSAPLPHLRLDDLLDELQARLDAARGTRDRVHGLLEAVLAVGRDWSWDRPCGTSSRRLSRWSTPSTAPSG